MRRLLVALTLLCALGLPASALADTATGATEIALKGRLAGHFVATDPAAATSAKLSVPGYEGTVGSSSATLTHSGVVQLKTKRARLNLVSLRTTLGGASKTTAVVGGKRITLLNYSGTPAFAPGSARLNGAKARISAAAAKAIKKALGLKKLKNATVGTATIGIAVEGASPTDTPSILWRPRESFIRYMNSETGSLTVSGGAQEGPEEVRPGTDVPLVYSFSFPGGVGTLSAKWQQRGIDLSFTDPQVSGNTLSVVYGGTTAGDYAGKRVDMLTLDPSKATAEGDVPAVLTEDGSKAFAGFYSPGDEFGTVRSTTAPARRSASIARKRKKLRIVALSPFTANTLVDLGIKPIAIANTLGGQDRFRRQLKGVKRLELSHPNGPNLEQLASLNPDIVLSSPTWSRGHKAMRELGMRVVLADPTAVDEVPAMSRKLGALVGKRKRAEEIATLQEEATEDAEVGIKSHPRVLAVLGVGRAPYAFLPGSWGGDLVIRSGGELLGSDLPDDGGFAKISDEQVVAYNPDVIIAVPHGNAKDIPSISEYLRNNPSWKNTNAGRNDRIYVATDNAMLQPFTDPGRTIRDIGGSYLLNR